MEPPRRPRRLVVAAAALGSAAVTAALGSSAGSVYLARRIVIPDRRRPDDTSVVEVSPRTVTVKATDDARVPGRFGLWLDGGAGHARLGRIVPGGEHRGEVTRELIALDRGRLRPGPARWNPYFFGAAPDKAVGLATDHVFVPSEVGALPAWRVERTVNRRPVASEDWAVLVHGRGARREECVRAIPVLHSLGYSCLVPQYRNDEGAPSGPDGRYYLGLSEWRDVHAAMAYAVAHGAKRIVLVGWSMGGAIVLQAAHESSLAGHVVGLILDAPVIDWKDVLRHQGARNHVPSALGGLATALVQHAEGRRLLGALEPVALDQMDWVSRAGELAHRVLMIHSVDDEFVPSGPSRALSDARPDLVTWVDFDTARHCQEWNVDSARWEGAVRLFLTT